MKRCVALILFQCSLAAHAQEPFNTMDSISVNKVNVAVLAHGDIGHNPITLLPKCEFPAGTGKQIGYAHSLWMSGYDAANQLHVSAQTYRQGGNDYWPGPLDAQNEVTYAASADWAKFWKVSRAEIQFFQALKSHSVANTPEVILTWPGRGNVNARGSMGAPLLIPEAMAPFADLNGNGIYEPLLGEYPDVPGDQALWWVFSDKGTSHDQTRGEPFGIEVHAMAFAYSRGTLIDNVVYFDYTVTNKSQSSYYDFRLGLFADLDVGYPDDDYIGYDSTWRMAITYNALSDDGGHAGHPSNSFGVRAPVVGATMVVAPGDADASYVPAGSFLYYNNEYSVYGNPGSAQHYANYVRGLDYYGNRFVDAFAGHGINCSGRSGLHGSDYVFTDDPSDPLGWSECRCGNNHGDRRVLVSSRDFSFVSGSVTHMVMALVATDPDSGNFCPGVSFDKIRVVADTAWRTYYRGLAPKPAVERVLFYPNPAHDQFTIDDPSVMIIDRRVEVFDLLGKRVPVIMNFRSGRTEINTRALPAGVYVLRYRNGETQTVVKFVKE